MILSTHDRPLSGFHCMDMILRGIFVQIHLFEEQQCEFSYLPFSFVSYRLWPSLSECWFAFYLREPLWYAVYIKYDHRLIPYLDVDKFSFLEDDKHFVKHRLSSLIEQGLNSLAQMLGAVLAYHKQVKRGDLK